MSKHTPGPWEYAHSWVQTADHKKTPIANFNFHAATEANARLIAAAPDLLQALLNLVGTMCAADGSDMEADLDAIDARVGDARAAIAKATGVAL
jgi:hypothetical protein